MNGSVRDKREADLKGGRGGKSEPNNSDFANRFFGEKKGGSRPCQKEM